MGKSALLAKWLARREAAGVTVPHHFIRRGESDWDDPMKLVGSLVAQLELKFPKQREQEGDARMHPAARLDATLQRVSEHELAPRGERLVVLIDGLDEYDPPAALPGRDPLAAFLPRTLPRGVNLLCSSRPRHPYVDMLATRGAVRLDLDERDLAADNEATVRAFWGHAAPELGLDERFVDEAVVRASGNLQHAAMLRLQLGGLQPQQLQRVDDIPRGLSALIANTWERISTDPIVVDGLGVLCAAREALTLDELGTVLRWEDVTQRQAFMRGAHELLIERQREGVVAEYRLHHESIRAHIAGAVGANALRCHHHALAQTLASWPAPSTAMVTTRQYALHHALTHRIEAGEWAEAWRLAADMGFVEAKCRELGAHDAEAAVVRAAERCQASGDEVLRRRFIDLAQALGSESHWLRAAPEASAALVWNRLRRSGWSAEEIDQQLHLPAGGRFLRLRHLATRESPELVRELVGHAGWVNACAVTPEGRHVVSGSDDRTLKVWDLATGQAVTTLEGHASGVLACSITPDGRHVVSASSDNTLKVWDLAAGREVTALIGHAAPVSACAVTPDGRRVVSASDDRTLKVWDLMTGRAVATLEGHAAGVNACAVAQDGHHVVSGAEDRLIKIWDIETGREAASLVGHASGVILCSLTRDGRRVVSGDRDRTLKVWDLETKRAVTSIAGHSNWTRSCAVTVDGHSVVSGAADRTLKIWDLESGRDVASLAGHAAAVTSCAVTPDGRRVVSASWDKTLKVWDLKTKRGFATSQGHAARVQTCAVTPDGRRVVSGSLDKTLKVWDLESGREVATMQGHGMVFACAVTPDGQHVVSGCLDKTLKVWDLAAKRMVATLQGHAGWVTSCAITMDGRRVVSTSADRTLRVWDLKTAREVAILEGHAAGVSSCAVTPDGRHVVSGSNDGVLKIWNLETGREVATLEGHNELATTCAVTPDGRRVASGSWAGTIRVWDLMTGLVIATLVGHVAMVNACAMTPDGRHLVSGAWDRTLKVWDLETGSCLHTHHTSAANTAVAVTDTAIVVGDAAGAVWFLDRPR